MGKMKIPYSCLTAHGDIVFAARGGQIQSFKTSGGAPLSTWRHPCAEAEEKASKASSPPEPSSGSGAKDQTAQAEDEGSRPAKKLKLEDGSSDDKPAEEKVTPQDEPKEDEKPGRKGRKGRKRRNNDKNSFTLVHREPISRQTDLHIIVLMSMTSDGKHLVAVSGHDKAVWTFEHDGNGTLTESCKRTMPKRPSDIVLTPDDTAILVADKFGDVYCFPLTPAHAAAAPPTVSLAVKHAREPNKPAANEHTVHSQINRRSLEMQLRDRERHAKQAEEAAKKKKEQQEEFALLLGHVSMLTAITIASHGSRKFILTADRDEHIRVSRYMPQAYVIENFCLGHRQFVNCLRIPDMAPEVLISGGGEDELFMWDWAAGSIICKARILPESSQPTKVAVTKISSRGDQVLATCEGHPTLFRFHLTPKTLTPQDPIALPGPPLDFLVLSSGSILITCDVDGQCLTVLPPEGTTQDTPFDESSAEGQVLEMSADEVKKLFYTTEHLRKQGPRSRDDAERDDDEEESEVEFPEELEGSELMEQAEQDEEPVAP